MKIAKSVFLIAVLIAVALFTSGAWAQTPRWPEQKANAWYAQQPWLVGSNYTPKSAINQLEMWQEATFNPEEINQELSCAESLGMKPMPLFLQHLPMHHDPARFPNPHTII